MLSKKKKGAKELPEERLKYVQRSGDVREWCWERVKVTRESRMCVMMMTVDKAGKGV